MSPRGVLLLRAWGPAAAWGGLVFAVSSFPVRVEDERLRGADTWVHLGEYAVLGILAARALHLVRPGRPRGATVALAAALAAAYGATDEVHQLLVPERAFEWKDLAADAVGGLLGAAGFAASVRGSSGSPAPRRRGPSDP